MQAEAKVLERTTAVSRSKSSDNAVSFLKGTDRVNAALDQLEDVVAQLSVKNVGSAVVDELTGENQQLKQAVKEKDGAITLLNVQLKDMESKHKQVSGQVEKLSGRLEELIKRLGKVLES